MATIPSFEHEIQYWQQGINQIAGLDEVGMGALAGPVAAAAVIFDNTDLKVDEQFSATTSPVIRDSKTMSAKQRVVADKWIKQNALAWAVGEASVEEIDEINIRQASHLAMHRAVESLSIMPELLLIDGTSAQPHPRVPAINIIHGDQLCYSIAAASIVAKVYRDKIMENLSRRFPQYGWASNKGYGSLLHKTALQKEGVTIFHRKSYAPVAALVAKQSTYK